MIIYKVQFYEYNSFSYDGVVEKDARYFLNEKDAEKCRMEYLDNYVNDFGHKIKCPGEVFPMIEHICVE